jgi:hypothetical protein
MKIKTATKWALIGAIVNALMSSCYILLNAGILKWSLTFSVASYILSIFTSCTFAMFFYVLYKNQK